MKTFIDTLERSVIQPACGVWQRDYIPLVIGAFAFAISASLGPQHATKDFFDIAAQIIPLLIVAIALEARVLGSRFQDVDTLEDNLNRLLAGIEKDMTNTKLTNEQKEELANQRTAITETLHTVEESRPGYRRYKWLVGIYVTLAVIVLGYGEIDALNVIAQGKYLTASATFTFGAIVCGLAMIIVVAVRSPSQ